MKVRPTRYHDGKPVFEIEYYESNGRFLELARTNTNSPLVLFLYDGDVTNHEAIMHYPHGNYVFCPLGEDEITRNVRFAHKLENYESEGDLLQRVDEFIGRCVDLDDRHRFLLACFV